MICWSDMSCCGSKSSSSPPWIRRGGRPTFFVGLTGWFDRVAICRIRKPDMSQHGIMTIEFADMLQIKPPRPTGHPSLSKEGSYLDPTTTPRKRELKQTILLY